MMNHIEGLGKKVADLSSFGKQFLTRYYKAKKKFLKHCTLVGIFISHKGISEQF